MRARLPGLAIFTAAALLAGCEQSAGGTGEGSDDAQTRVAELESQLNDARSSAQAVSDAADQIEMTSGELSSELEQGDLEGARRASDQIELDAHDVQTSAASLHNDLGD